MKLPKLSFRGAKNRRSATLSRWAAHFRKHPIRMRFALAAIVMVLSEFAILSQPYFSQQTYALGGADTLLPAVNQSLASKIKYDASKQTFSFNTEQAPDPESTEANNSQASAVAHQDPKKGLSVTDPVNKTDFKLTPKFDLLEGKQEGNRIVYPLRDGTGWAVYTMQTIGVKEDIILTHARADSLKFDYTLGLGDGLNAKIESDGSIGVYGNTLLSGNISTGTEKDAELLQKARKTAPKNTLLFRIPAPVIIERNDHQSKVKASYALAGDTLSINVTNLEQGNYPLSIDPSIFVATAEQFMYGNNETNIDFDVDNKLIKKGRTTGARFDQWNSTTTLPTGLWGAGTAAAGGYIYTVGGASFSGQTYSSQGGSTFVVPSGVTSIDFKMWGGGGGSGSGGTGTTGGAGGGAGYVAGTIPTTPGETLTTYVGGGGGTGTKGPASGGGAGGGHSSIYRSSTALAIAAGGAGGGGGRNTAGQNGGAGGAGGGTTGVTGSGTGAGPGGTQSAGGTGSCTGTNGASLDGGNGGDGNFFGCSSGGGGTTGGLASGGNGGNFLNSFVVAAGGGAGGGGYFGGAGGISSSSAGGGGGGGGSSYTAGSVTSVTNTAGSGVNPGNSADSARSGAGQGGATSGSNATGNAGTNGIIIISYGAGGAASTQAVNWAKFNTTTGTVDSANPGNGACSGWCTTSVYNLPAARANFSMVAYNGFLYAFGGTDSNCTTGNGNGNSGICKTVYIAKLGANGEPRLWHPTDANPNNWVYWYADTNLSSERAYSAAVAYNNRMYLLGGRTASGAVTTTEIADIEPMGTLGSWTASTAVPSANSFGTSAVVYNDRLYVVGGASSVTSATATNTYAYNKINSDGTLNSWITSGNTTFSSGRLSYGGNLAVVAGAYMYISGGCAATNASGYCTSTLSDTQVASINADGSLDIWNTVGGVTDQRMGGGLVAWRDSIYEVGGCIAQNTSTGNCDGAMLNSINYGTINQDGDASTVGQSSASGAGTCTGGTPTGCNLPGTTHIGNMLSAAVITNGYLYVIGGCTHNQCSTVSNDVAYVAISSTGQMSQPATCPSGTYQGGWCVRSNVLPSGIAASSAVLFGGNIYLVGGLTGSANTNTIVRSTVNNDGSFGTWNSQSLSGAGAANVSYHFAYARANPSDAAVNPGHLFIFGGCTASSGAGCTSFTGSVYKCNIQAAGTIAGCNTTFAGTLQLQIGTIPGGGSAGLGIMSGAVYANYIYLIGGATPSVDDLDTIHYAKFDNNNNVVAASGSAWVQSDVRMNTGRRRSAAFGYNGYLYAIGGYEEASGVLPDIEFAKINVSDGTLEGIPSDEDPDQLVFNRSQVQINQRWGLTVPISNSYAYVIGGCTSGRSPDQCSARTDIIQTFQIYNNDSGAPAGYATSANTYGTNPNRIGASSAILNGYLYTAGGCTSATDCTTAIDTVSYTAIDVNGALGSWQNTTAALPAVRTWGKLEAAGGSLYYIGGQSSTATDRRTEVYYGTPSSGNVSSWGTASNGLPSARTKFGATVWNDRLYVVGGEGTGTDCTGSNVCSTVYVSPQLTSGGNITSAWSTGSTSFNVARSGPAVAAYANNLYLIGGFDGTNYLSDSQYSQINSSTGLAGSWTYSQSMPSALSDGDAFAANGYLYILGGRSAATVCDPVTLVAPISANTSIASGNNPTGLGMWYETNQRYTGARYGTSAVYHDGRAYVLGGACGASLTYASPVTQQTTLLSQPQLAKYSIMVDTDSDVYPTHWLLNGLDNSIGARWQLKYRSMTDPATTNCVSPAMTTWGQETNFGNVTLGLPGVYTPLSGSGANTNCARYYYFNVTVDSSQAYGYPDDVTRGPTIDDLTLHFTADPSKRLMHGRTFTGGLQQPIDTPYN